MLIWKKNFRTLAKTLLKNTYVHYKSNHPTHIFRNIIYNQILRLKLINSRTSTFITQLGTLKKAFLSRGYPKKLVYNAIDRAIKIPRQTLLGPKRRIPIKKLIRCKVTHSIRTKYYQQRILKTWQKHNNSPMMRRIWPSNPKFILCNQPNLKKILVRAKTT